MKFADLDLQDMDTGPVQLIIGTNNSDLILPKWIVKPSGQAGVDRVPYEGVRGIWP